MTNKRQLEESLTMFNTKRIKTDEGLKESISKGSILINLDFDTNIDNYEMYKMGLHDREYLFGMINNLDLMEDIIQDNTTDGSFRCPVCLQALLELFQLSSHRCITEDLERCKDRSSSASTALTSTRKDIGELLERLPKTLLSDNLI